MKRALYIADENFYSLLGAAINKGGIAMKVHHGECTHGKRPVDM